MLPSFRPMLQVEAVMPFATVQALIALNNMIKKLPCSKETG